MRNKNEWDLRTNWLETWPWVTLASKSNRSLERKADDQERKEDMALHTEISLQFLIVLLVQKLWGACHTSRESRAVVLPCTPLRTNQIFLANRHTRGLKRSAAGVHKWHLGDDDISFIGEVKIQWLGFLTACVLFNDNKNKFIDCIEHCIYYSPRKNTINKTN